MREGGERSRRRVLALLVTSALVFAGCDDDPDSSPRPTEPSISESPSTEDLEDAVTVEDVVRHLEALQTIADDHGGTRAAGTPGYQASVEYVSERLRTYGYEVELQEFTFPYFAIDSLGRLEVEGGPSFDDGPDFKAMLYSSSGRVSALLSPVDFDRDTTQRDGPGCSPSALESFPHGAVALLRPGPCLYRDQVLNAQDAGAAAVVFAVPDYAGEREVLRPTLISPDSIAVPVVAVANDVGLALDDDSGHEVVLETDVINEERTTTNVIASSPHAGDQVIMAGGHLDSVLDGPGINDNGSGIATLLEVAEEMARADAHRDLRVAFWGGEEVGLLGSTHYVESLDDDDKDAIGAYLNFDMLGSPNHVNYVYDDSGAPRGSEAITGLFEDYFEDNTVHFAAIDLAGRSDHGPFLSAGIPIGGLFTGADMAKSAREARRFGGEEGEWQDPCYHQACDDIDNVDAQVLDVMADAVAHALANLTALDQGDL